MFKIGKLRTSHTICKCGEHLVNSPKCPFYCTKCKKAAVEHPANKITHKIVNPCFACRSAHDFDWCCNCKTYHVSGNCIVEPAHTTSDDLKFAIELRPKPKRRSLFL